MIARAAFSRLALEAGARMERHDEILSGTPLASGVPLERGRTGETASRIRSWPGGEGRRGMGTAAPPGAKNGAWRNCAGARLVSKAGYVAAAQTKLSKVRRLAYWT